MMDANKMPTSGGEVRIVGIGAYLPSRRVRNMELIERFHITPQFLHGKLGFTERCVKEREETTSDLCVKAFEDLAASAPAVSTAVQLLCVVTQNPDYKIPHTAAIVHQRLGLPAQCMTFDLSQGCAGYVHGIAVVVALMTNLRLEHAVLLTCDPYSKIVDPDDRDTALLFGDAATATRLLRTGGGYSLVGAEFGTAPNSYPVLKCEDQFRMDGRGVFLHAAREVPRSVRSVLAKQQLTVDDVDLFLFHPGSKHMVDTLRRELRISEAKLPFEAGDYGNTVSSSIPLMLKSRLATRAHPRIVLSGFGVGFSWGSCVIEAT